MCSFLEEVALNSEVVLVKWARKDHFIYSRSHLRSKVTKESIPGTASSFVWLEEMVSVWQGEEMRLRQFEVPHEFLVSS